MSRRLRTWTLVLASVLVVSEASQLAAQPVEVVGARALGMGGAFVAVADDASAVYWNPSGLARAGFFGALVDIYRAEWPRRGDSRTAWPGSASSWLVALGTPPLGVTYYKLTSSGQRAEADAKGTVPVGRLDSSHAGVTVLQSVGDYLTLGTTLKYVRGVAALGAAENVTSARVRDRADELDGTPGHAFDLDVGALLDLGTVRVGLLVRNATEPEFAASGGQRLQLSRQVRLGVAVAPTEDWLATADADLVAADAVGRPHRRGAFGLERWLSGRRFGLRAGVRLETQDAVAAVGTLGFSIAVGSGVYLDAFGAGGDATADTSLGLSARVVF